MKLIATLLLLTAAQFSSAQLISGDLLTEGRKLVTETNFIVEGSTNGVIYYELAVNREGEVTSERLLPENTTVVSTPTRYKVKSYLRKLNFQPGTYYPKFHHVVIKVTTVKAKAN